MPALRKLLEEVLPTDKVFNDYEVHHNFEDLGHRVMLLNARRLDHVQLILLGISDITERFEYQAKILQNQERLQRMVSVKGAVC